MKKALSLFAALALMAATAVSFAAPSCPGTSTCNASCGAVCGGNYAFCVGSTTDSCQYTHSGAATCVTIPTPGKDLGCSGDTDCPSGSVCISDIGIEGFNTGFSHCFIQCTSTTTTTVTTTSTTAAPTTTTT